MIKILAARVPHCAPQTCFAPTKTIQVDLDEFYRVYRSPDMATFEIFSKAAFTRQRTGQAQSEHYAHGHGHGQTFLRTESAHAHTGPTWLQRRRHAGAQRAAGTILTTCHTTATDTTRRDITHKRSDTRRRMRQQRFAHCKHRTHRADQARGLGSVWPDDTSSAAHQTSLQRQGAQAARTRPSPCDIEHRRDGLQGRRCAR